jgi:hypothetical protein
MQSRLIEVPVNWEARAGSKVDVVLDSLKMLHDILRIRLIHRYINGVMKTKVCKT